MVVRLAGPSSTWVRGPAESWPVLISLVPTDTDIVIAVAANEGQDRKASLCTSKLLTCPHRSMCDDE